MKTHQPFSWQVVTQWHKYNIEMIENGMRIYLKCDQTGVNNQVKWSPPKPRQEWAETTKKSNHENDAMKN